MDPELKAEFQEAQKRTVAGQQGFGGAGRNPVEGFDIAGYLSGSGSGAGSGSGGGGSPAPGARKSKKT